MVFYDSDRFPQVTLPAYICNRLVERRYDWGYKANSRSMLTEQLLADNYVFMKNKNIELEIRAVIAKSDFSKVLKALGAGGKMISKTKRLSVMYFGTIGREDFDIRLRVTDGDGEIVLKKGAFHAHNRIESGMPLDRKQFLDMVRIVSLLGFKSKVGVRETYNFRFKRDITVSLVRAKDISYLEIERMSVRADEEKDRAELAALAQALGVRIITEEKEYYDLCDRLTREIDWEFRGTASDFRKLKTHLSRYFPVC